MSSILSIFGFDPAKHSVKVEVLAGLTTFLTMSYILAVNPLMLSDAGMDKGAVFSATVIAAVVGTLIGTAMGAKMMPLTASISEGIVLGMLSYIIIKVCTGEGKQLSVFMYVLGVVFLLKYIAHYL